MEVSLEVVFARYGSGIPIVCTSAVEYMRYANVWLRRSTAFVAEIQVGTETFALHTIENGWMVEQFRRNTHMFVLFQKENDFGYVIKWLFDFIRLRCELEGIDESKTFEAVGRLIESEHWDRLRENGAAQRRMVSVERPWKRSRGGPY